MTGATITLTGMPAEASLAMVSSRRAGEATQGSRARARTGSRKGRVTVAEAAPWEARAERRSTSRSTSGALVVTITGFRYSAQTSRQPRVSRSEASSGCQASVLPEKAMGSPVQEGRSKARRRSSGARSLATMRVSKSVPAPKPRYSWVGRA